MNYDLSSIVLRSRVRLLFLNSENFKEEVTTSILETSILNESPNELKLSLSNRQKSGAIISNGVRFLTLKPALHLEDDLELISSLQLAFVMERGGVYGDAEKIYRSFESKLDTQTDEAAFVSLHRGFCLAVMGKTDEAIQKLKKTVEQYPGTHYADTAELILSLLLQNVSIRSSFQSANPSEKALHFFALGDCFETLLVLENLPSLNRNEQYMRARCIELKGEIPDAVRKYIDIIQSGKRDRASVLANRRLMIIGKFKFQDKIITERSIRMAETLNDNEAAEELKQVKSLSKETYILSEESEKVQKPDSLVRMISEYAEGLSKDLKQAKDILLSSVRIPEKKTSNSKAPNSKSDTLDSPPDLSYLTPTLKILLANGRIFFADTVAFEGPRLVITSERYNISIPNENIITIGLVAKEDNSIELKYDWLKVSTRSTKIASSKVHFVEGQFRMDRKEVPLGKKEMFPVSELQEIQAYKTGE